MRTTLHLALLAPLVAGPTVLSGEHLSPTIDFDDMRVVVTYVSTGDLMNLQHKYGARIYGRQVHAFSILKTNRETGARTCEIYLHRDQRPREVDDEGTLTLGHELLHCMLGDYHR